MPVRTANVGVQIIFDPDPAVYANAMVRVAEGLRDRTMPLMAATQYAREDMQQRFLTETDPEGIAWKPWAKTYAPRAAAWGNPGILRLGTDIMVKGEPRGALELYKYVTNPKNFSIDGATAYFHAGGMPKWGWWHQEGKPNRTTARKSKSSIGESLAVFGVQQGGGVANPLPKRSFMPLSTAARALIIQTFREWFDNSIELFNTSTGIVGRRHRIQATEPVPGMRGRPFVSRPSVGKEPLHPRP